MVYRTITQTYDMNTEKDCPTFLGVHSPIGRDPINFLWPFYAGYKKVKYLGADITVVNAARLPVDPEQLGKIDGQNYISPRDTLDPIMFMGCHGEDLGGIISSMYGGLAADAFKDESLDKEVLNATLMAFYNTALGDSKWRKSGIQKTLHIRGLHPLVYNLATTHQIAPTNWIASDDYAENNYTETGETSQVAPVNPQSGAFQVPNASSNGSLPPVVYKTRMYDAVNNAFINKQVGSVFTNRLMRLGWMDTLQFQGNRSNILNWDKEQVVQLPKIFMGVLMLPAAHLTRQYLRVIITHKFKFSGYRTITTGATPSWLDLRTDNVGYNEDYTGNIPDDGETKLPPAPTGASVADATDYDQIEEDDED